MTENKPISPQPAARQPGTPAASPASRPAANSPGSAAMIGKSIRIVGEIRGEDSLTIEGQVDGRIQLSKHLKIGASGTVKAEIDAEVVTIGGRLMGNATARQRIEILPTGEMTGDIRAPRPSSKGRSTWTWDSQERLPQVRSSRPKTSKRKLRPNQSDRHRR